jgi:hypothetical protein
MGAVHEWAFSSRRVVVVESLASRRAAPARLTLCCNLRVVTVTHVPPPTNATNSSRTCGPISTRLELILLSYSTIFLVHAVASVHNAEIYMRF